MECNNVRVTIPSASYKSISLLRRSKEYYIRKASLDIIEPGDSMIVLNIKRFLFKNWYFDTLRTLEDRWSISTPLRRIRKKHKTLSDNRDQDYMG